MSNTRKAVAAVAAFLAVGVGSLITSAPASAMDKDHCPYGYEWCDNGWEDNDSGGATGSGGIGWP
ncbi:hypothetical protein ABT158_50260 [Nonomuraea sp. NPDC001636]|uniref:hypothetical protein n=1 Tax=Nonomuraea sp. NPDC001636 TaxID=3154391 RepID=UPI00332BE507